MFNEMQEDVGKWILSCFNEEIANDGKERNFRFLEEALELVQANGCTKEQALELVDYVFSRPVGEIENEVGGTMVTLAALCNCLGVDMEQMFWKEHARINKPEIIDKIRKKQLSKPRNSSLPGNA
jgi:NTP pyrophosphatase (non-canonical NTP hydrolase)